MYRAYIGNLDGRVTEETLESLFQEHGLDCSNVLVKRGYAFVDCPDQAILDKAIDQLNGYNLMGSSMQVEPSTSRRRRGNRIQIQNAPTLVTKDDVEHLVAGFGTVQRCDLVTSNMETTVHVTYETPEQAKQAVDQLNGFDYQGNTLKVDYVNNNGRYNNGNNRAPRPRGNMQQNNRGTGHPLRMLVPSDYVGAIIGRKGQTIRNITTTCKARIDVHRDNSAGLLEKVISIYGQPENCSNACKEILKVMQQEAVTTNRGEIMLKILADDRHCGRIIGKDGKVIKKLREDTTTKITVSNVQEAPALFPDRVITIREASLDNMSKAEAAISTKLRECYERDRDNQGAAQGGLMMPPGMAQMSMMHNSMYGMGPGPYGMMMAGDQGQGFYPPNMHRGGNQMQQQQQQQQQQQGQAHDCIHIMVPNSSVGAIIGSGGVNIKKIIRDSSAFVTIETRNNDDPNPAGERTVTIKGYPDSIWLASYYIHERLKQEGFAGNEEVRLRTATVVPRSTVGRLIGKGGKNVRDLQRMSGTIIKLPEEPSNQGEEVKVEIFGTMLATQNALARIRSVVNYAQQQMGGGMPPPPPQQQQRRRPPPPAGAGPGQPPQ